MRGGDVINTVQSVLPLGTVRYAEETVTLNYDFEEGDFIRTTVTADGADFMTKCIGYEDLSKTVDVLLVAGQSNALGQYADSSENIKVEEGTVYYNTLGNSNPRNDNDNIGWSMALAKQWHDKTGHTVVVAKAAYGGTGFAENKYGLWGPNNGASGSTVDCYSQAKDRYAKAVESVKANSEYKFGTGVYFWLQGENENGSENGASGYSAQEYEDAFLAMHNGFMTEFGDADTRITCGGILPVRSSSSVTFPGNLHLTGPRIAQYHLTMTRDDLCMVSDITESWHSDATVKSWFEKRYGNIGYANGDMPDSMSDIFQTDHVHYKQKAHNEMGRDAADNMLAYLNGENNPSQICLITDNGIKYYKNNAEIHLDAEQAIPVLMTKAGEKAEFTVDGNAYIDEYGVLHAPEGGAEDYSTLEVSYGMGYMRFKLYPRTAVYNGASIASVKDNKQAVYTFVTDDGVLDSVKWYTEEFNKYNLKGTVAMVTDWVGTKDACGTWDEWRTLINGDGSVFTAANHSKSHPNLVELTEDGIRAQVNDSRAKIMSELPGQKVLGFCLPYNQYNSTVLKVVKEKHTAMRGSSDALNTIPSSRNDLYNTSFKLIVNTQTADDMNGWVDAAVSGGKWLMELWHGIEASDSYTSAKEIADNHFNYISDNSDKIWVADWDDVIRYTVLKSESKIVLASKTNNRVALRITNDLESDIFDSELTINAQKPDGFDSVTVKQGSKALDFTEKNGVLTFNVTSDGGDIVIEKI